MAEAINPEFPFNPFDAEVLMLLKDEAETVEKRMKAKLVKDVKVEQQNLTKPLVTKPVWPYAMWHVNYVDSPSDFNQQISVPLSCTSGNNQPDQMSSQDHCSSLEATTDSCEGKLVCDAGASKDSLPRTEAIEHKSAESLSMEDMADLLQRSVNMLSDLQDLLSIGVEKYFPNNSAGRNETDSIIAEDEPTQLTLGNVEAVQEMGRKDEKRKLEAVLEENLQLPNTDDKSTPLDVSSERATPTSQNNVNEENVEYETKDVNLKSIHKAADCEDVCRSKTSEAGPSSESDGVSTVCDAVDFKENTTDSAIMRSQETMETNSDEKSTGCKGSQMKSEALAQDMGVKSVDKVPQQVEKISTSKVCHFKTELQSPVSAQSVLYKTITKWLPNISIDSLVKTKHIKELVRSLMNNAVLELQTKHHIFSKCYIIETGSVAEDTKIGQPDEFDFMIALPMLADSDVTELFFIKLGIQTRLHNHIRDKVLSFLSQFSFVDSSYRHYLTNAYLLQVFRDTVRKHLPHGWSMREESDIHMMRVYLKNQTLTLHLQCESGLDPGFILSVDVCFGIPLDAERLQTVYVADHTHALHLSFVRSECLRMNTEVVAVISRNPLVAERFFFQTEPNKFHGKKLAADCYKLAKNVARRFLPKVNKNNCGLCEDTLIPSFYMKTVMSFMMDVYTETSDWSETWLGNRLIEIFEIISYSFHSEYRGLAYYTCINSMKLDCKMKYSPADGSIKVGIGMDGDKPCTIPRMEDLNLASSCEDVRTAVQSYWKYMMDEEWVIGDLLQKLIELLYVLKFTESDCNL